jgi:hypothetical protein
MEDIDKATILAIISAVLALSELLPFISNLEGNGVLHTFLLILKTGIKALKEKGIDNAT